jgi:hypothetical protein
VPWEMTNPINPAPILQREARLWLAGIRLRIGGKTSIRNPYLFTQFIMFSVIVRNVRRLYGFVEPFCFHSDIKKAIVIYFTLMRFVNELFALLSGLSKDVVPHTLSKVFQLYMDWRVECQWISSACLLVMSEIL